MEQKKHSINNENQEEMRKPIVIERKTNRHLIFPDPDPLDFDKDPVDLIIQDIEIMKGHVDRIVEERQAREN